jgi:hypothetical protein
MIVDRDEIEPRLSSGFGNLLNGFFSVGVNRVNVKITNALKIEHSDKPSFSGFGGGLCQESEGKV